MERKLTKVRDIKPEDVEYVLDGWLPRSMLSMIAGKRRLGKSLAAAYLAAAVSKGDTITAEGTLLPNAKEPGKVWYNTLEDPTTTTSARLQVLGAHDVYLTDWRLEFPNDSGIVRDVVRRERFDLVIFDSMQQHFKNPGHGFRDNKRSLLNMLAIVEEGECSILFVHHFIKGKTATVEAGIGGMGVIQNMVKSIHVFGEHPDLLGTKKRFLACESINAPKPEKALAFEGVLKRLKGTNKPVPVLEYTGLADVTAWDVYVASKKSESGSGALTSVDEAAGWIIEYMAEFQGAPVKVRDVEAAANDAKRYFSKSTFDRARAQAGVEPVSTAALREAFGDEFNFISDEELPPKARWVRLATPQLPKDDEGQLPKDGNDQLPKEVS